MSSCLPEPSLLGRKGAGVTRQGATCSFTLKGGLHISAHLSPPSPRSGKSLPLAGLLAEGTSCPAGAGGEDQKGESQNQRVSALEGESNNVMPIHFIKPHPYLLVDCPALA